MRLGFVSAILPELSLEEVLAFAANEGFGCVELMCWPAGVADRRYAGVTHVDVARSNDGLPGHVKDLLSIHNVAVSALGYYPNPLDPDPQRREAAGNHLREVIAAAPLLGVRIVNTFLGRDPHKNVEENWAQVLEVWPPLAEHAKAHGVRLGIENCPMLFSNDEWPGGKNLAISPELWRRMLLELPTGVVGLNFDPSHLVWLRIDYVRAIREFGEHFVHVHAKDTQIDEDLLYERGVTGLGWHKPKLPGLGDVVWRSVFSALSDVGYTGAVCIEVEDKAYEGSLDDRKRALRQSKRYLDQWIGG